MRRAAANSVVFSCTRIMTARRLRALGVSISSSATASAPAAASSLSRGCASANASIRRLSSHSVVGYLTSMSYAALRSTARVFASLRAPTEAPATAAASAMGSSSSASVIIWMRVAAKRSGSSRRG